MTSFVFGKFAEALTTCLHVATIIEMELSAAPEKKECIHKQTFALSCLSK